MRRWRASELESLKGFAMLEMHASQKIRGTYLATSLAHVRLLAGVDALVHGEGGALDELLAAVRVVAHVRADAAVDTFCRCQCIAFDVPVQAPYHDVQGHCVARSLYHRSSTRRPLGDPCPKRGAHRCAGADPAHPAAAAAARTRARAG
jgi:hypothetical protein